MTVRDVVNNLNLKVLSAEKSLDRQVSGAYVSDLLSDVMAFANSSELWITLQQHKNIVAIASLKKLSAIILVKNLEANEDTLEKSEELDIPILQTDKTTFEISGLLYNLLNSKTNKGEVAQQ